MEPTSTTDPGAAAGAPTAEPAAAGTPLAPVDPVAPAPATAFETLAAFVDAGGPVVLILAGLSVLMLATALLKTGQFLRVGVWRRAAADEAIALVRRGRPAQAAGIAGSGKGIAARIVASALDALMAGHDRDQVRDEAQRQIDETAERLQTHIRILEIIASLAPLLGLFGTVLGMIEAFHQLEASGSRADPSILSGGIWEALLTTAVGLAVAMPAVVLVNLFDRTVESFTRDMDNQVAQIFIPPIGAHRLRRDQAAARRQGVDGDGLPHGSAVPAGE